MSTRRGGTPSLIVPASTLPAKRLRFYAIMVMQASCNRWYIRDVEEEANVAVCGTMKVRRALHLVRALNAEHHRIVFAICRNQELTMYGVERSA